MRKKRTEILVGTLLMSTLMVTAASSSYAQTKTVDPGMPKVGDMAPDFTLKHFDGNDLKDVKLSDYRGKKNVVVAFYVFAFTGG
jgi:hypothetical protein